MVWCLIAMVVAVGVQENSAAPSGQDGWTRLFDGATLEGWHVRGNEAAWGVSDGELIVHGPNGGWIVTNDAFRDFELLLEFMVPEGGNSGVGLRVAESGDPAFSGMEVQILGSHGESPTDTNCGAVYNAIAPRSMAVRPAGEWNTYRITLEGKKLDVELNGETIHDGEVLDDRGYTHQKSRSNPLGRRRTTGQIALQDHGAAVRFRNIWIRDLSPDRDPGGFTPLPVDPSLQGWHAVGEGVWEVQQGVLVGHGPGCLISDAMYDLGDVRADVLTLGIGEIAVTIGHDEQGPCDAAPTTPGGWLNDKGWSDVRVRMEPNGTMRQFNGGDRARAVRDRKRLTGPIVLQVDAGTQGRFADIRVRHQPRVLLFSKTAGFRHGSIGAGLAALRLISKNTFLMTATEDPAAFTTEGLEEFDAVVFLNTTQDVLDDAQQAALEAYIRGGGGWVGIHAAADTEYDWPFYGEMLGGAWFASHPQVQEATIEVERFDHPAMRHLPARWTAVDEWYDYRSSPRQAVTVLASLDHESYEGEKMSGDHPIIWCQEIGDGRIFYTGRGHTDASFREPAMQEHLRGAILWAAGQK